MIILGNTDGFLLQSSSFLLFSMTLRDVIFLASISELYQSYPVLFYNAGELDLALNSKLEGSDFFFDPI